MDKITAGVRAFYEAYPYPPGGVADCLYEMVEKERLYCPHSASIPE
ncbi:MAG: hypothetical protein KZQ95_06020 [Candidatus Thiodiazotropha sp. (ex Epidulcina cf. delphinae)]|nr:hypothetical protein [Candidatus Thiodiazotropha sp. (ex Epidulcina cf. delphinae)]